MTTQGPEARPSNVIDLAERRLNRAHKDWDISSIATSLSVNYPMSINNTGSVRIPLRQPAVILAHTSTSSATLTFDRGDRAVTYRYDGDNTTKVTIKDASSIRVGENGLLITSQGEAFNYRTQIMADGICTVKALSSDEKEVLTDENIFEFYTDVVEKGSNRWGIDQMGQELNASIVRMEDEPYSVLSLPSIPLPHVSTSLRLELGLDRTLSSAAYDSGDSAGVNIELVGLEYVHASPKGLAFVSRDGLLQSFMLVKTDGQAALITVPANML